MRTVVCALTRDSNDTPQQWGVVDPNKGNGAQPNNSTTAKQHSPYSLMDKTRVCGTLALGSIPNRGTRTKQKHDSLMNRAFVLETELLQFRARVPGGDMFSPIP